MKEERFEKVVKSDKFYLLGFINLPIFLLLLSSEGWGAGFWAGLNLLSFIINISIYFFTRKVYYRRIR